jgi:hypothetical protein
MNEARSKDGTVRKKFETLQDRSTVWTTTILILLLPIDTYAECWARSPDRVCFCLCWTVGTSSEFTKTGP